MCRTVEHFNYPLLVGWFKRAGGRCGEKVDRWPDPNAIILHRDTHTANNATAKRPTQWQSGIDVSFFLEPMTVVVVVVPILLGIEPVEVGQLAIYTPEPVQGGTRGGGTKGHKVQVGTI